MTAYTVTATVRSKAGALDPEAATTGTGTSVAPLLIRSSAVGPAIKSFRTDPLTGQCG